MTLLTQVDLIIQAEINYLLTVGSIATVSRRTIPERKKLAWKASVRGLVELIYALHQAECFGKKNEVYLIQIAELVEEAFDIKVTNQLYVAYGKMKDRGERSDYFIERLLAVFNHSLGVDNK